MDYWNHNAHHHPLVLDAVPDGCATALDIGCGEGLLARRLAGRVGAVTGVDRSGEMVRLARERGAGLPNADFAEADFLDDPHGVLAGRTFDFVSSVAVVHHADFAAAVTAMVRLLAPGGRLAIVGLARDRTPFDRAVGGAGVVAHRLATLRHGRATEIDGMPVVWPPSTTWGEVRRESGRLLPGRRYRRHLLWRYSLVWEKPAGDAG